MATRKLERRTLGKTGMTPCILGLGCAWFGSEAYAAAAEIPPEIWVAFKAEFGVGL